MWSWTRQSVAWYARAAEQSTYHADLARAMQPFINPAWTVADMGCGPGFLSLELAGMAARVEAFDTDPLAIRELERRTAARRIANVHPRFEDAMACTERFGCCVLCFFGQPGRMAASFLERAGRVLAVVNARDFRALVPGRGRLGLESDAETAGFLEGAGIPYRRVPLELEFGQPLDSFEEALAFAAHYGRDASPGEAERWLEARLVRLGDGSYYLPHAKKLALYAFPA